MQIRIEKSNFFEGVQRVQSVVDKKNTIPVLSNILVEGDPEKNTIRLIANNLEVGMSTVLPVSETTEGSITIPAQKLFEILRELPDSSLLLKVDQNNWVTLECSKSNFKLAGLSKADFPELPTLPAQDTMTLSQVSLKEMIAKTAFAVSHDESRYALTGVLFSISQNDLSMVATDGHRLAVITRPHTMQRENDQRLEVIIPVRAMNEAKKLCDSDEQIIINVSETQIAFRKETTMLVSRLVDAQFPDYRQVLPAESRHLVVMETSEFQHAIRRVALLCSDTRLIKFNVSPGQLKLSATNPNLGEAEEIIPVEYTGEEMTIGFNAQYVLDFISVVTGNKVTIGLNDPINPGLFLCNGEEDAGFSCVIMPMRV